MTVIFSFEIGVDSYLVVNDPLPMMNSAFPFLYAVQHALFVAVPKRRQHRTFPVCFCWYYFPLPALLVSPSKVEMHHIYYFGTLEEHYFSALAAV